MVDTCHHTFIKEHRMYNRKNETYCKLRNLVNNNATIWFINCNKYTTLMQDVNNRANYVYGRWELIGYMEYENSAHCTKFFCKPKTALKLINF